VINRFFGSRTAGGNLTPPAAAADRRGESPVSVFDDAFAAIEPMFAEVFGDDVTYLAGTVEITWNVQVVLQRHETLGERGVKTTIVSRDYVGSASELGIIPEEGHRIREIVGGETKVFEVMPIADAPCWEPADESGRRIVVRTKEVD
jgi:hypothetical protein